VYKKVILNGKLAVVMSVNESITKHDNLLRISLTSSFTDEVIKYPLKFWAEKFNYHLELKLSPYRQVFQQLIDKNSAFNDTGSNARVICLRIEDWMRDTSISNDDEVKRYLHDNVNAFCNYVKEANNYSSSPIFIYITENSPASSISVAMQEDFEAQIQSSLSDLNSVYVTTSRDIRNQYPVDDYYDEQRDRLGHIPFTDKYFTALGTAIFRKVHASLRSPYKVIVLDCDNTLWDGVCGEAGPDGIKLSKPFRYLQSFMLKQKNAGKILCLCSKNVQEDVDKVFDVRSDMTLTKNDIVASKINWMPKSINIKELSNELNLGLDSFIFIDDNPVECAEVRSQCPQVLTLNLPEKAEDIPSFLENVWAFDALSTTSEDKNRTKLYKENIKRTGFKSSASSMKDFIEGLNLNVEIREPMGDELSRVSQLTLRTNQFNFTTIRRTEQEIRDLSKSGYTCTICRVKDRFGDYGLVGVMIYKTSVNYLELDSLMLSCRVLGRGVEHKMLRSLGEEALKNKLPSVKVNFSSTSKNLPAKNFLDSVKNGSDSLLFSTEHLLELEYDPESRTAEETQAGKNSSKRESSSVSKKDSSLIFELIGKELQSASSIQNKIKPKKIGNGVGFTASADKSDEEVERIITSIWKSVLEIEQVRPNQHFFDVGGTSLKAVEVLSNLNETFNKNFTVVSLFEHSTIHSLVHMVQGKPASGDEFSEIKNRAATRRQRFRSRR